MKRYQDVISLRCEPALTAALDAIDRPPVSQRQCECWANGFQSIEAALHKPGTGRVEVKSITPEYIAATVRTKKFRNGEWSPPTRPYEGKLSAEEKAEIRASDEPATILADRFGVSRKTIGRARRGGGVRDVREAD